MCYLGHLCDELLIEIFSHIIDKARYEYEYIIPQQVYLNKRIFKITVEKIKSLSNHIEITGLLNITDDNLKKLDHLESIYLEYNTITDEGIKNLTNLKQLTLCDAIGITDEGIKYLTNLTALSLHFDTSITNRGLQSLTNLEYLSLYANDSITDEGIKSLTKLRSLQLANKNITIAGLIGLKNLEKLKLCHDLKGSLPAITLAKDSEGKICFPDMKHHPNFSNMKLRWSF